MTRSCSAVLVNWNSGSDLEECLASLSRQVLGFDEVLVVDNGSSDGSQEAARRGGAILIELGENQGFARAANIGVEQAKGELVALVNPDVVLNEHWLENIQHAMDREKGAAMAGGRVVMMDDPGKLENTGHLLYADGMNRARSRMDEDGDWVEGLPPPLFPSGCAAVYSRDAFLGAGGFCEHMFAYGEDADLGLRLRMAGFGCAWAPRAIAWHRLSGTTGRWSAEKAYLVERNRMWVLFRCFPLAAVVASPAFTLARHFVQGLAALSKRGAPGGFLESGGTRMDLVRILAAAYRDGLAGLPERLNERASIRAGRPVPDLEFYEWLVRHRAHLVDLAVGE